LQFVENKNQKPQRGNEKRRLAIASLRLKHKSEFRPEPSASVVVDVQWPPSFDLHLASAAALEST
jgi:hypothetical protein